MSSSTVSDARDGKRVRSIYILSPATFELSDKHRETGMASFKQDPGK